MYKSTILALTLMGMVSAQSTSTVVDLYLVGFDDSQNLVGSIIASDKSATTYSITCASTATSSAQPISSAGIEYGYGYDDCGVPDSFTFTQGPSTVLYTYGYSDVETESSYSTYAQTTYSMSEHVVLGCVLSASSLGLCSETVVEAMGASTFSSATTANASEMSTMESPIPVTITAGATASASSASATSGSSTGKSSGSKSGSAASATKSSVSTAGMPVVTAKAQWIIGGAAAAVAYAAM